MTTWHRATIKFQYSPKNDLNHRSITSVTTQVYGNTESAAMQTLRKMYPKGGVRHVIPYKGNYEDLR